MPSTWTLTVEMDDEEGEDWGDVGERMEAIRGELADWIQNAGTVRLEAPLTIDLLVPVGCERCGHSEPHELGEYGYCQRYGCVCFRRDGSPVSERMRRTEETRGREAAQRAIREREERLAAQRLQLADLEPEPDACPGCRHGQHRPYGCHVWDCHCEDGPVRTSIVTHTPSGNVPSTTRPQESAEDITRWLASL